MREKLKFISVFLVLVLLFNVFSQIMNVYAYDNGKLVVNMQNVTVSGNTVTCTNGYGVTLTATPAIAFSQNTNGSYEADVATGTNVTYTLNIPNGISNDQIIVPDILINGAREFFTQENGVYSFTNTIQFFEGNVINFELEFPAQNPQGNPQENPGHGGMGEVAIIALNGTVQGHNVTYTLDETDVVLTIAEEIKIDMENNKQIEVAIDGETGTIEGIKVGNTFDNDTMKFVLRGENEFSTILSVVNGKLTVPSGVHVPNGASLNLEKKSEEDNHNDEVWNQTAYFVWATDDSSNSQTGKFYYKKLTNLAGKIVNRDANGGEVHHFVDSQGNAVEGYEINYIRAKDITAENDPSVKYSVKLERTAHHSDGKTTTNTQAYEFIWSNVFEGLLNDDNFVAMSATDKMDLILNDEHRLGIDPTGAESGSHSISTNGDRTFRATIYDEDKYEGLRVGVPENYTYFPAFWDKAFYSDVIDISETTKENPAVFEAFLLEKTLQIGSDGFSAGIDSVKIADNTPNKAVTITPLGDRIWNITYNSNFFDHVKFEITDYNGKKYYVVFSRINIKLKSFWDGYKSGIFAEVYYPAADSYKDYEVIATVEYKDGTNRTTVIETPSNELQNNAGDLQTGYEISGGENLKLAWYELPEVEEGPNSNVEKIYLTVTKKGSTSKSYAGTLTGSGMGREFSDKGEGIKSVF